MNINEIKEELPRVGDLPEQECTFLLKYRLLDDNQKAAFELSLLRETGEKE